MKELIEKGAKTSAQLQASDGNLHVLNDAQTNVPEDKRAPRVATRSRGVEK